MRNELRENHLCWTFLYDVTFSMVGLGNPVSSFLEMRLPCISKSQATPSHKSLPEKIIVLLTAGKEGSFFFEFFIEIHNSCFQKKSSKVTWIAF